MKYNNLNKLKNEIETKRNILNELVLGETNEVDLINHSEELDKLIFEYHNLEFDKNKADN